MGSERKIYLRILLAIGIGMAVALGLVRLFAWLNDASGETFLGRVLQARAALPRIVQAEEDLVMVFGSSMVEAGFSPRHFDRLVNARGGEVKSWNFGFGGLNPYYQDYLSRRVREAFEEGDRRLELALIEFNPFQVTRTRWQRAEPSIDSFITLLASEAELRGMALADPERGALLYTIRYLRDNVSAEMTTTFFGRAFQEPPRRSERPGLDEAGEARLAELSEELDRRFEAEYPDWVEAQWSFERQGGGTVPWERPAGTVALFPEYYALLHNDRRMEDDLLRRIATTDILELDFEPLLIESFIAMVENFKAISNHVEVILLPRNTDWVNYSPEVAARLQAVLERIEAETGVPVRNHQDLPRFDPSMFGDTTHLGRYVGDIPYTEFLAEQYAPLLIDGGGAR